MTTTSEIRNVHDRTEEVWQLPVDQETLRLVFRDCFQEWEHIDIDPLSQDAAWELKDWHFHISIGGSRQEGEELPRTRPTARAELSRDLRHDAADRWAIRLFNDAGEQQLTIILPSPFLSDDQRSPARPDWSRLALWDRLRKKYLGLDPDPIDRAGNGFSHGAAWSETASDGARWS